MYEEFTQNRIAQLRMQKNVSARDMSLSLGQNNSYINQIENKKALPSLQGLFYICEYFGITPQQFFDDGSAYPVQLADLVEDMKKLDAASLEHIAAIVKAQCTLRFKGISIKGSFRRTGKGFSEYVPECHDLSG